MHNDHDTPTTPNHAALFLRGMGEAIANDRTTPSGFTSCATCNGHGYVSCDHPDADDYMDCHDCDGGGIIDTRSHYSPGFAQWLAQAVKEDDPANGGQGILTIDDADADAQRLDEIDAYLASPAARWAPCGTLDALDDERAELQRRIEDRRIANTRNAQSTPRDYAQPTSPRGLIDWMLNGGTEQH